MTSRRPSGAVGGLLLELALDRAFAGDRDDGLRAPPSAWLGTFGRVRFDWSVGFATLPRRLAPARPIEPTGATYLYLDLTGAPADARVAFRAEWESPVVFQWAVVRVGTDGGERSRVIVTAEDNSTSAERNIEDLGGLAGTIFVGVNVGDIDLQHRFDPDELSFEPHGYVVTLAR
jgi:hypothetical protein